LPNSNSWTPYVKKQENKFDPIRKDDAGDEFIKRWCNVYEEYQWDTPHIPKAAMHVVLGQVPSVRDMKIYTSKARYEDGRVHVLWLQPSGTGKQGAIDFVEDVSGKVVADGMGLTMETPDDFTDAAILGTYEEIKRWSKEEHGWVVEKIPVEGWLAKGVLDIFAMPECSVLFEAKSQYKENLMVWFQRAMDPIGRNKITKKLAKGDAIYVNPVCSFFLTSYIPPSFTKRVTERGLVQRMITIINEVPIKKRHDSMLKGIDGLGLTDNSLDSLKTEREYLSYYMSELNEPYKNARMKADPNVMSNLKAVVYHIQDMLEGIPRYQQEQLSKFTNRSLTHAIKLTYHHAILRRDNTVEIEDVSYAEEFLYPIWKKLIHHFQDALETDVKAMEKEKTTMYQLRGAIDGLHDRNLGKNGWVFEQLLIGELCIIMRKKKDYVRSKVRSWVDNDLLEKTELKGHPMVRLKVKQPIG